MNIADIRSAAFAMPLTSPAFPRGPYRFARREHLIISYETDPDALRAVVPEPQQITGSLVKYEFIRMPDSTGFGDYTESGQVIPVSLDGVEGSCVHAMYRNDHPPIAGKQYVFLEFNAWLYQGFDDARQALLQAVSDKLIAIARERETFLDKALAFRKRIRWLKIGRIAAPAVAGMAVGTAFGPFGTLLGAVSGLLKGASDSATRNVSMTLRHLLS